MTARRFFAPAALACLLWSITRAASAQVLDDSTRNAARDLATQGRDRFDHHDFERARDLFHRAYTLVPAPTIALYEARALANLQRLVEAEEAYMRAVRTSLDADSSEPFRKAVRDADRELGVLRTRIPKVTLVVSGAGAQASGLVLTLDGRVLETALVGVETPIDPGDHVLAATIGESRVQLAFSIAEKTRKTVELEVPAATSAPMAAAAPSQIPGNTAAPTKNDTAHFSKTPGSLQKTAALVVGGAGVAGVVTGVVTGLLASGRYSDAEDRCPRRACLEGSQGANSLQAFRTLRTASTIGYIAGGVGLAAGATLFVTAPKKSTSLASVDIWVGANAMGVGGKF